MPRMQRIKTSHCVGRKSLALWLFFLNLVGCSNDAGWVDVCVNRSFTHDHAADELGCTDHYLPRFAVLKTTGKAPPLVPALAPPLEDVNVTTFLVIMQGGRVGSTWLYELLDGHPHVSCEGEVFNEHPCQGHSNVRHQKQMQRFIEACNTTACGFKIMFNVVDNRISKAALNYMLQRPNLKVVCLTRRNVYEQTISSLFKKQKKCLRHQKHGKDDCRFGSDFEVNANEFRSRFANQRTFVDYCWSFAPFADVLSLEYDKLLQEPLVVLNQLYRFLGVKPLRKLPKAAEKVTEKDIHAIKNLDEIRELPKIGAMMNKSWGKSEPQGCSERPFDLVLPLSSAYDWTLKCSNGTPPVVKKMPFDAWDVDSCL